MAQYKYASVVTYVDAPAFDTTHSPGTATPYSGIYRCEVCGREIVSVFSHPLPAQNHHQHPYGAAQIRWRLIVASAHK